jgi:hypothetical protein
MSSTANSQTVGREAQDSSVRSVNLNDRFPVSRRQQAKARSIARQISPTRKAERHTAATLVSLMAAFGGHITRLELPAQ